MWGAGGVGQGEFASSAQRVAGNAEKLKKIVAKLS
jgi:hypothetical protein